MEAIAETLKAKDPVSLMVLGRTSRTGRPTIRTFSTVSQNRKVLIAKGEPLLAFL